jgi:4-alpha-glucanotransferase
MFCGLAFGGGSDNPHLLHNHEADQVVYTGTHDNDTVKYYIVSPKYFSLAQCLPIMDTWFQFDLVKPSFV